MKKVTKWSWVKFFFICSLSEYYYVDYAKILFDGWLGMNKSYIFSIEIDLLLNWNGRQKCDAERSAVKCDQAAQITAQTSHDPPFKSAKKMFKSIF